MARRGREARVAIYAAVAATPTLKMDAGLRRLSRAADHSRL
jgi:hypothetical protein